MPSELEELFKQTVKKTNTEIQAAKKDVELEKLLKELELTDVQYKEFLNKRDEYKPSLYDIDLALDDDVVQEYKNRMALFTLFILAENNVYVSGVSGSGKSQMCDACLKLVMPNDCVLIEGSSEKAIFDMERQINKAKYIIIRELNKLGGQTVIEFLKSAGEKKEYRYRRAGGVCGGGKEFVLKPLPFVFTRATESAEIVQITSEMMSRVTELSVNGDSEQTAAVLDRKAEFYENPFAEQKVDMVERSCLKYYLSNLPKYDLCINPAAKLLKENIPTTFTTARRQYPVYEANLAGITRFHYWDRMTATINGKSVIFAAIKDMWWNHLILGDKLIESSLRCNELQRTIMQIITKGGSINKADIQRGLRTSGVNATVKIVETHLNHLADLGYLSVEQQGRQNFYSTTDFYHSFEIKPDFKAIIDYATDTMHRVKQYKAYADEYVQRFCEGDGLIALDPFTGKEVNILQYNWKSVLNVQLEDTRMHITPVESKKKGSMNLSDF